MVTRADGHMADSLLMNDCRQPPVCADQLRASLALWQSKSVQERLPSRDPGTSSRHLSQVPTPGLTSIIVILTPASMMVSFPSVPTSAIFAPAPIRYSFWRRRHDQGARGIDRPRQVLNRWRPVLNGRWRIVVRRGRCGHVRSRSTIAYTHIDLCMTWYRSQGKGGKQRE